MKVTASTRAGRLLQIAHTTYRRGEPEIAKDIFVLAMEEPDADQTMQGQEAPSEESLKAQLMEAMEQGDLAKAQDALDKLQEMQAQMPLQPEDGVPPAAADDDGDDDDDDEPADAPADEPAPELPPAQVAMLVALAKRIKSEGHADLAGKITAALGL